MDIDLRSLLLNDAGVAAQVSDRVSWLEREQGGATPAIVLTTVSAPIPYILNGVSDLHRAIIQVDVWAKTYADSYYARQAVIAALSEYKGTVGVTDFEGIFIDNRRSTREAGITDADKYYRESIDIIVHHKGV